MTSAPGASAIKLKGVLRGGSDGFNRVVRFFLS